MERYYWAMFEIGAHFMDKQEEPMKFEIYQGADGQWYWRLVARNGKIIADGCEGYKQKRSVTAACHRLEKAFYTRTTDMPIKEAKIAK
jgi:uncharacterized protein YegP (UPF0339 family)